jgi:hypothetical protein
MSFTVHEALPPFILVAKALPRITLAAPKILNASWLAKKQRAPRSLATLAA